MATDFLLFKCIHGNISTFMDVTAEPAVYTYVRAHIVRNAHAR